MNRRGHIGTALMPFLALILIVNALFIMQDFNSDISKKRAELRAFSDKSGAEHNAIIEIVKSSILESIATASSGGLDRADFEEAFNKTLREIINPQRISGINTNVYAKIANGEYAISKNAAGNYVLIVNGVFDKSSFAVNEATYYYSIEVVFDRTKVLSIKEF